MRYLKIPYDSAINALAVLDMIASIEKAAVDHGWGNPETAEQREADYREFRLAVFTAEDIIEEEKNETV